MEDVQRKELESILTEILESENMEEKLAQVYKDKRINEEQFGILKDFLSSNNYIDLTKMESLISKEENNANVNADVQTLEEQLPSLDQKRNDTIVFTNEESKVLEEAVNNSTAEEIDEKFETPILEEQSMEETAIAENEIPVVDVEPEVIQNEEVNQTEPTASEPNFDAVEFENEEAVQNIEPVTEETNIESTEPVLEMLQSEVNEEEPKSDFVIEPFDGQEEFDNKQEEVKLEEPVLGDLSSNAETPMFDNEKLIDELKQLKNNDSTDVKSLLDKELSEGLKQLKNNDPFDVESLNKELFDELKKVDEKESFGLSEKDNLEINMDYPEIAEAAPGVKEAVIEAVDPMISFINEQAIEQNKEEFFDNSEYNNVALKEKLEKEQQKEELTLKTKAIESELDRTGKGVLKAQNIRNYIVNDVEEEIKILRNEKGNEFVPAEIQDVLGRYKHEVEELQNRKNTLSGTNEGIKAEKNELRSDIDLLKDQINEKYSDIRKVAKKVKEGDLTKEDGKAKVIDIQEKRNELQVALQEKEEALANVILKKPNTKEQEEIEKQIDKYNMEIENVSNIKIDEEKNKYLDSYIDLLERKEEALEMIAKSDIDLNKEVNDIYANLKYDFNEKAQAKYDNILNDIKKVNVVYDIFGEEIDLLNQRKEYLENKDYSYEVRPDWMKTDLEPVNQMKEELSLLEEKIKDIESSDLSLEEKYEKIREEDLYDKRKELIAKVKEIEPTIDENELSSLKNVEQEELSKIEEKINLLTEERKKYNFAEIDLEKKVKTYDDSIDYTRNFYVMDLSSEEINELGDKFFVSKGIPLYSVEKERLIKEGKPEEEIKRILSEHPETILDENLEYDNDGRLIGLGSEKIDKIKVQYDLTDSDVYRYRDLIAHYYSKLSFEAIYSNSELNENERQNYLIDKLTDEDRKKLERLKLYEENGDERQTFPELRKMVDEKEVPLEILLGCSRKLQADPLFINSGYVEEEKTLGEKLAGWFKSRWKKIVAVGTIVLIIAGFVKGCSDKEITKEDIKDATDAAKDEVAEEVVEVNDDFGDVETYLENNGYTVHDNKKDNDKKHEDKKDKDKRDDKEEDKPVIEDSPYITEGSFWQFGSDYIYYDGTVEFVDAEGYRWTAKLPVAEYWYDEEGHMRLDGALFEYLNETKSINAAYNGGQGMLQLEDIKLFEEEKTNEEQTDIQVDNSGENNAEENIDNTNTEENYDEDLPSVEEAVETGEITEDEAQDAIDSVLDELNEEEPENYEVKNASPEINAQLDDLKALRDSLNSDIEKLKQNNNVNTEDAATLDMGEMTK